jgi:hypothetical protein
LSMSRRWKELVSPAEHTSDEGRGIYQKRKTKKKTRKKNKKKKRL